MSGVQQRDQACMEEGTQRTRLPWRRRPTRESASEIVRWDRVSHPSFRAVAGPCVTTAAGVDRRAGPGAEAEADGCVPMAEASCGGSSGSSSWGLVRRRPALTESCVTAATSLESVLPDGSEVRRPPTAVMMWRGDGGCLLGCIGSEFGRVP